MSVIYQEITDPLLIPECVAIQKEVFHLSDIDMFPASFFSLLIRKEHPLGMLVGCFEVNGNTKKLVGLNTLIADSAPNSLYSLFVGLIPEYQDGIYGYNFTLALKKIASKKGIKTIYSIIDPLESNIIKLYIHFGAKFIKHINNPYSLNNQKVSKIDKSLVEWKFENSFDSRKTDNRIKRQFKETIEKFSIIDRTDCTEETFLIEVPDKYLDLLKNNENEAHKWRLKIRELLNEYLNNKGYAITDFVSGKINKQKKIYYLLQKNH